MARSWDHRTMNNSIPTVSNSITVRLELPARPTAVSELTTVIESGGGLVTGLDVTASGHERLQVDVTAAARDSAHADALVEAMRAVHGVHIAKVSDRTFLMHLGGKLSIESKVPIRNRDDMSMVYTPGVARVCMAIAKNPADARRLTIKRNTVAVVTDGSAVLGLGNIGPLAAMPVMEGKAALFKRFGGIDAFPICLDTQDVDEIVAAVKAIAPVFAGINLEDISAPRCFEVEARLRAELDLPVFHDDQHGTAIVVLAALRNALRVVGKDLSEVRIVQSGAGPALHDPDLAQVLADYPQGVAQRSKHHDRGAVLVVVEDREVEFGAQPGLDLETTRGRDVLEVDAREDGRDCLDSRHNLVDILGVEADGEGVDAAEPLEQGSLALHDGHGGQRADIAQTQHRAAIGHHRDRVALDGQPAGIGGVLGNRHAYPCHPGGVDHGHVVAIPDRHLGLDAELSAQVHQERAVAHLGNMHAVDRAHRLHQRIGMG